MLLGVLLMLQAPAWAGPSDSGVAGTGDTGAPVAEPELTARGGGGCTDGLALLVFFPGVLWLRRRAAP